MSRHFDLFIKSYPLLHLYSNGLSITYLQVLLPSRIQFMTTHTVTRTFSANISEQKSKTRTPALSPRSTQAFEKDFVLSCKMFTSPYPVGN